MSPEWMRLCLLQPFVLLIQCCPWWINKFWRDSRSAILKCKNFCQSDQAHQIGVKSRKNEHFCVVEIFLFPPFCLRNLKLKLNLLCFLLVFNAKFCWVSLSFKVFFNVWSFFFSTCFFWSSTQTFVQFKRLNQQNMVNVALMIFLNFFWRVFIFVQSDFSLNVLPCQSNLPRRNQVSIFLLSDWLIKAAEELPVAHPKIRMRHREMDFV